MSRFFGISGKHAASEQLKTELSELREQLTIMDEAAGVGLWQAVLVEADAMHAQSRWTWSQEMRRLLGFETESEFPNLVGSWSDRLHPDDAPAVFKAFNGHLTDRSGKTRYDVTYRLKMRDGSYRWFRATGGCRHSADGKTIRCCGSLTDINDQKNAEQSAAMLAHSSKSILDAVTRGLHALVSGDLTHRLSVDGDSVAEILRADFNKSMEHLQATLGTVSGNAQAILSGTQEIAASADDLARRTEQQAASLEETAAALDEITATVKKTAEGATHARKVVSTAKADAEVSGNIVRQAIEAMSSIETSSNQISQIIGVIDEIAFQTNLLALNAGVEAARAGDAGRGFAVVASEVRGLAQRSAEAAKEIKGLISTSSGHVAQGVDLVGETGKALGRIVQHVSEIDIAVGDIASSAQEQATALHEVNTAVNNMDQVTQQNAAMVEQSNAASQTLSQEAGQLTALLGTFKTGGSPAPLKAPAPARTAPPRPAAKPVASRPVAAMKTTGSRGVSAAPKSTPAPAEDGWEEF